MDELTQLLNNTAPTQANPNLIQMDKESKDRIRLYNPTDQDFTVLWDAKGSGGAFPIPNRNRDIGYGKGQAVHVRYIARKYVREMTDKIINDRRIAAVREENRRRISSGMAEMTKWGEQELFESRFNVNQQDEKVRLFKMLWVGVEEQYGMELPETDSFRPDTKSLEEELKATLERPAREMTEFPSLDDVVGTGELEALQVESPPLETPVVKEALSPEPIPTTTEQEILSAVAA